ncbi:MAG: MoaD/ThiS family protein [Chloroflexi bacterium]|nr:MoaD/ThiS family protein [Chloroflexota bacterium]
MIVRVRLYGAVRHIVRQSKLDVEIPEGSTIRQVIDLLGVRYGAALTQKVLRSDGRMQTFVRLYHNDTEIDDDSLNTPVNPDTDTVPELSLYVIMAQEGG